MEFIARDSPAYASALAEKMCAAGDSLAEFSNRGRKLQDPQLSEFREIYVGSYRLIYRVEVNRVLIVAIVHGSRDLARAVSSRKKHAP